ncbi:citrate/2-methylcitrate synthase [Virgibacillus phasianinus]|nr:citrate/2-methylcitrate synthase [Virgibacillus phasianinus]
MYQPGLKGVIAVETELSNIDGAQGILTYRGTEIQTIIQDYSFEEIAYFLLHGKNPLDTEFQAFQENLKRYRIMPAYLQQIIDQLPEDQSMMDVLRTAISAVSTQESAMYDNAVQLIAITPTIIAYRFNQLRKKPVITPNDNLDHVANFMIK